ncbi:MAG: endospore germination permease [Clostridiales bacterium]|jgi:spore germination protein KB|nr:endospore germination permease [Clostridiales bacterium]
MVNEEINGRQVVNMIILFLLGSSLVTGNSMVAEQDSWISVLIGIAMSVPVVLIYARLYTLAPKQDLFDLSYQIFGKIGGAIITILFSVYTLHLGILVIKDFTEYINVVSLPETPQLANAICIGLIAYFTVIKGIEILGRGTYFVMPFVVFVVFLLTGFTFKYMDINNLKPILTQDIGVIFNGALSAFTFPLAETVLFINVFSVVNTDKSPASLYLTAVLVSGFILFVLVIGSIMVLGFPLVSSLYFPSYSDVRIVDIGNFLSRIEVLVSANYIVFGLVKVTVCLYVSCKGFAKLFNLGNFKMLAAPLTLIMVITSTILYENTMKMFNHIQYYKFYAPLFQIVIPLIIMIFLQVKSKKQNAGKEESGV